MPIRVVVVDADEPFAQLLDEASNDEVVTIVCASAARGLNACCAIEPDCVVVALELSDREGAPRDGLWLAAALREQPTSVASLPILMLTTDPTEETRMRILQGGVDVVLEKPVTVREVLSQVRSLVAMARRLAERSALSQRGAPGSAPASSGIDRLLEGQLEHMAIATVLTLLELNRASGALLLTEGPAGATAIALQLSGGALTSGRTEHSLGPVDAMKHALLFSSGRFRFLESAPRAAPAGAANMGQLVLAALRSDRSPRSPEATPSGVERALGSASFPTEKALDPPTVPIGMPPPAPAPRATPPPTPTPARPAAPVRRTTLASQPAVDVPIPAAPKRRHSEMIRSAIKVQSAPPPTPPVEPVSSDDGGEKPGQ